MTTDNQQTRLSSKVNNVLNTVSLFEALLLELQKDPLSLVTLPEKKRAFICTKCGSSECEPESARKKHPLCAKCNYIGFGTDILYSDEDVHKILLGYKTKLVAAMLEMKRQQARP